VFAHEIKMLEGAGYIQVGDYLVPPGKASSFVPLYW
jgi:hypothetical protein